MNQNDSIILQNFASRFARIDICLYELQVYPTTNRLLNRNSDNNPSDNFSQSS